MLTIKNGVITDENGRQVGRVVFSVGIRPMEGNWRVTSACKSGAVLAREPVKAASK